MELLIILHTIIYTASIILAFFMYDNICDKNYINGAIFGILWIASCIVNAIIVNHMCSLVP